MSKFNAWLNAARLRTLPLSVSGVITGTALANYYDKSDLLIFLLALLTTIAFQVTSNFANDYGDGVKGTDNHERVGPKRALQSGLLSRKELRSGILIAVLFSLLLVLSVVLLAFGFEHLKLMLLFLILGLVSIWAAIKYTIGKSAYGYRGLGDLFVFVFFGLLAVLGTMFLYAKYITMSAILPAVAIGALSTGVLNLNNLRDFESDTKAKKNTMIVQMGLVNGKRYHYLLLGTAFVCILIFLILHATRTYQYLPLLAFVPIGVHLLKVFQTDQARIFDPELKKLALSTFLLAILMFISYY